MLISGIREFDKKRKKIILDEGAESFLLYNGELRTLALREGEELSGAQREKIFEEILKPRAKKKVLYYLKDSDKTSAQIRLKLKQGGYPQEIIEDALAFLERHRFVDDKRYAETYTGELKGKKSRREIIAKLKERGISGSDIQEALENLNPEDEYAACEKALRGRLGRKRTELSDPDRQKAYAFLARKGYSYDAIEHAFHALVSDGFSQDFMQEV
ncbi:MAG: regulatory protein RecX [Eubacteriales bacterium]|nr:regulatory protein RecX [Eubacteriales bacterium]